MHAQAHPAFCSLLDFSFKVEITSNFRCRLPWDKGPAPVPDGDGSSGEPHHMKLRDAYRMTQRRVLAAVIKALRRVPHQWQSKCS